MNRGLDGSSLMASRISPTRLARFFSTTNVPGHSVRPGVAWMPFGGFVDAGGTRRGVNVLTAEEPTDWGGGSGLYDAFVEVARAEPHAQA